MSRPGFLEGVGVAFAVALGSAVALPVLSLALATPVAAHAVIALVGLAYLLYLIARTGSRTGKVVLLAGWLGLSIASIALGMDLLAHAGAQIGLAWLLRALAYHRRFIASLTDGALCAFALGTGIWAAHTTGSLFLTVWSVLLVQAAFVAIPDLLTPGRTAAASAQLDDDRFARAHRAADTALRRLYASR